MTTRAELADLMLPRLRAEAERMRAEFAAPGRVNSTGVDDLVPAEVARAVFDRFPSTEKMMLKRSIKERKHVAAQMDACDALVEEAVFAFQDPRIVELVAEITGLKGLEPDVDLYAGGISVMRKGGYLRPHLDNSHDGGQARYRVLNLLWYVTPDWREEYGGSLQLWDHGPLTRPRTIPARFNRLVLMATNQGSWHSVDEIVHDGARCCVSNYYFSRVSPEAQDYFHATSFRDEKASVGDLVMRTDNLVRSSILRLLPGVYKNPHVYKRK
jgi:Rps23 Pro-64 3,4-dihydroxylase Tpa1-like proline 4-hydroxylase